MMKFLKYILAALTLSCVAQPVFAQSFFCGVSGVGYCQYTGKLSREYVNEHNTILVYFEQPIDASLPATVGITGASGGSAGMYNISSNEKFADYLYSTALTALAGDKSVAIQFRTASGLLVLDRIWIYK